jgi:peptidoglycan/xylan/chitin deacetylase (PgdA/CDA1 family)
LCDALENDSWHDLPDYPLIITIDDGHAGNARLEEVIRAFGVRPMIYLCSRIVGTGRPFWWKTAAAISFGVEELKRVPDAARIAALQRSGALAETSEPCQALSWTQVEGLTAIADFGGHTRNHPILPRCDDATSAEEIIGCKADIEAVLGKSCRHFAYPNGDYSEREIGTVRRAGYRSARTIEVGWNGPDADPYRLKVIPIYDCASTDWLRVQMTGVLSWYMEWLRQRRSTRITLAANLRPVAEKNDILR